MLRPGNKPYQRIKAKTGYVFIWVPYGDPYCPGDRRKARKYGGQWSREHRYVMAKHLGRMLKPKETVHHINGVRHCNRLSNLELWTGNHGRGARRIDLVIEWLSETAWREVKRIIGLTRHATKLRKAPSCPALRRSTPKATKVTS